MTVTVKYFGMLAEQAGIKQEELHLEETCDLSALKERCYARYRFPETHTIQVAVNQSLAADGPLQHGDEIAFLPPFAGG